MRKVRYNEQSRVLNSKMKPIIFPGHSRPYVGIIYGLKSTELVGATFPNLKDQQLTLPCFVPTH